MFERHQSMSSLVARFALLLWLVWLSGCCMTPLRQTSKPCGRPMIERVEATPAQTSSKKSTGQILQRQKMQDFSCQPAVTRMMM